MLCILCCPLENSIVVDNLLQKGRDICTQQELHLQSNLLSEIFGKFKHTYILWGQALVLLLQIKLIPSDTDVIN